MEDTAVNQLITNTDSGVDYDARRLLATPFGRQLTNLSLWCNMMQTGIWTWDNLLRPINLWIWPPWCSCSWLQQLYSRSIISCSGMTIKEKDRGVWEHSTQTSTARKVLSEVLSRGRYMGQFIEAHKPANFSLWCNIVRDCNSCVL